MRSGVEAQLAQPGRIQRFGNYRRWRLRADLLDGRVFVELRGLFRHERFSSCIVSDCLPSGCKLHFKKGIHHFRFLSFIGS
jgi:hypothetical protein